MPRSARNAPGGMVFHVLNRRVDRKTLFERLTDYRTFEKVLRETLAAVAMRLCAYALMPNHWHLVMWPYLDGDLSTFMHRMTSTHTIRWKLHRGLSGEGHLYQNRFKSFPVQSDDHYLTVVRYVERNALRAGLVERAEDWPFTSLWRHGERLIEGDPLLHRGPIARPTDWVEHVNRGESPVQLESVRSCIRRGSPFGADTWRRQTAEELGLERTLRTRGRPKKIAAKKL